MQHVGRLGDGHKAEERADRGETGVAAAGTVAPLRLDMGEEVTHQHTIQVFHPEPSRRLSGLLAGKAQQQAEGVAVARDRVRARLHLPAQPVGEEHLHEGRKRRCRHRVTSPAREPAARREASSSSSGTASMYQ
jgi:hypothetical protein